MLGLAPDARQEEGVAITPQRVLEGGASGASGMRVRGRGGGKHKAMRLRVPGAKLALPPPGCVLSLATLSITLKLVECTIDAPKAFLLLECIHHAYSVLLPPWNPLRTSP